MYDLFSNREIATGFWLVALLILAFSKRNVRESFINCIKIFFG